MKRQITIRLIWILFPLLFISCSGKKPVTITIIETTDLHGTYFPFDFIENENLDASLTHAASYFKEIRSKNQNLILLDNGDNLQGQPAVYYFNFIDTVSPHIAPEMMNYLQYDAGTLGNHDIEAGHSVYDRLMKEYKFPLLAANAINVNTGEPYFKPYTIIERKGIRIAVFGMVTASIPEWLPPQLYSGIEFRPMLETARKWMPEILRKKPDLIIGLFHSGWNEEEYEENKEKYIENDGSAAVAYNIPGFDIIFNGHDHKLANEKFVNIEGDTVLMLNAGSRGRTLAQAVVTLAGKKGVKRISGNLVDVTTFEPDEELVMQFKDSEETIHNYVEKVIGNSEANLSSRQSYFGPSAFIDMIQEVQLKITGADLSFTTPLSFDVSIPAGPIRVSDMFKLYRYENMLYTMSLSGQEIIDYLEYSYGGWFNTMKDKNDVLLNLRMGKDGKPVLTKGKAWLENQPYNFDSAAGIDYVVDITKPEGERITVRRFSDGRIFDKKGVYKVAVNSYRGSGGGGHLTRGAGIKAEDLGKRLLSSTEKDLRYYILKYIESKKTIQPKTYNNWKIIPEDWVKAAASREYTLLFGNDSEIKNAD
ncbi:MAG TPA: bifunctional UDP-sugar hydrolase/5'-nucleotidase [Bacteroidales bacterium]|nr:bifunctional UDP-sugar hydrolase/5'-nucleotidase [Bacteroidales bacterium]